MVAAMLRRRGLLKDAVILMIALLTVDVVANPNRRKTNVQDNNGFSTLYVALTLAFILGVVVGWWAAWAWYVKVAGRQPLDKHDVMSPRPGGWDDTSLPPVPPPPSTFSASPSSSTSGAHQVGHESASSTSASPQIDAPLEASPGQDAAVPSLRNRAGRVTTTHAREVYTVAVATGDARHKVHLRRQCWHIRDKSVNTMRICVDCLRAELDR